MGGSHVRFSKVGRVRTCAVAATMATVRSDTVGMSGNEMNKIAARSVLMYALTRLAARALQATAAAALASDTDICSKHAELEDTPEHPVDLSVSKF